MPAAGRDDMSLRDEVASLLSSDPGTRARLRFGTIEAVRAANYYPDTPWPTVDLSLGAGPPVPGVRYDSALAPVVGQTVYCLRQGAATVVLGRLA